MPPKVLNDVSRVPKRQKQLWDDENDPSTRVSLNVFCGFKYNYIYKSNLYFFSSDKKEKLKFWGAIVGGKDLGFCVGFKAPFTNNNASEEEKVLGKAP